MATVAEVSSLGDVVIVLTQKGRGGAAFIRGHKVPCDIEVQYGEKDDPALTIRRVVVKAGWTLKQWRNSDPEDRAYVSRGAPYWTYPSSLDSDGNGTGCSV